MTAKDVARDPQQDAAPTAAAAPARRETPATRVLALQQRAGNRAVTRILAREPFHGDGKHKPGDLPYANEVGAADAARLTKAGSLSEADRADINAKLGWFTGDAHDAYAATVKPALVQATTPKPPAASKGRAGLERQVGDWFNVIQKLKHDRIEAWEKNARIAEPSKLSEEALQVAIAIVSEGMGGVVYGMLEKMLAGRGMNHLVEEFIMLAGLEAGDLAAESAFHHAMDLSRVDIDAGIRAARTKEAAADLAKVALKTKTDALGAYVEMLKLQTIKEEAEQHVAFNKTAQDRTDEELVRESAALKLLYDQLLKTPEDYLRALTVNFIRLLDESALKAKDAAHGNDRDRTFREDPGARATWLRPGTLQVSPTTQHSLGSWVAPDLNFDLNARAMQLNTESLQTMVGAELGKLPLTIGFSFGAKNPYTGWFEASHVSLWFTRDPAGRIVVDYFGGADEWLASYYTRNTREHTDDERKKFAPLGAAKLYDAIKTKPLKTIDHVD